MARELVKEMTPAKSFMNMAIIATAIFALTACGGEESEPAAADQEVETLDTASPAPAVSFKPSKDEYDGTKVVNPASPFRIRYRIIGTPIVGSPVTVDLRVASLLGSRPVQLEFRINDASSMMMAESQPASVRLEPAANETAFRQQVTVIPQREGRLYLNVSASFETEDGTMSTVTAIPIQVGSGTRKLQEHGEVQLDENGEAVRVLSND
ncbi:MAG: hypothetical protein IH913_06125 [Proteobacteria bacterium]|nr:hypothetical protein [Pseudomonadota bacterium]